MMFPISFRGEHARALLRLALPIMVGQVAIVLVGFVDGIMVGHHGTDELAAASFVNNFLNLVLIFGMGFAYGLTPMIAEADKQGRQGEAGALLRASLRLNFGLGLLLAGIMLSFSFRLDLFGLEPHLQPLARPYYWLQLGAFVIAMLFNGFKQFFDGMSHTNLSMAATIGGNLVNILLNYLLIFGKWGFPEWGLLGAGVASLAGRCFMLFVGGHAFFRMRWAKEAMRGFWQNLVAKTDYFKLIRLGLPVAFQLGLETASFTFAVLFVTYLSSEAALAAHQIVSVVALLGYLVYYGWGAATAIRVSHFRAMGRLDLAHGAVVTARNLGLAFAGVVAFVILAIRRHISYLFTPDPNIAYIVSLTLWPVVLYQFGDLMQIVFANALRGLERVQTLVPIAVLCHLLLAPILSYLFGFVLFPHGAAVQTAAIWWAFPISLSVMGGLLWLSYRKEIRQEGV